MAYKYETMRLEQVHELLHSNHPDDDNLWYTAFMAYKVAVMFEQVVNEQFVRDYLTDQLPFDALCELSLAYCVLYPPAEERDEDNYMYSFSHGKWLDALRHVKLQWTWNVGAQEAKVKKLMSDFDNLQELAFSLFTIDDSSHDDLL